MNLKSIKIADQNFSHAKYTTDHQSSKYIDWDRTKNNDENAIIFITDNSMLSCENIIGQKIGFLMEPRSINNGIYDWVVENKHKFKSILTYDKQLIDLSKNFEFYPHCGCWIKPEDQLIHNKTKLLSIIASSKNQTRGHKLRHSVISFARDMNINIDVYGRGYNPVDYKLTSLKDYAFSVVIENSKIDYYFTEKIIDCFMTGTVPIYWGCPSISKFFNLDGVIVFDDFDTLLTQLESLSLEKYISMLPAIRENFELAKEYLIAEDWIYKNTKIFNL